LGLGKDDSDLCLAGSERRIKQHPLRIERSKPPPQSLDPFDIMRDLSVAIDSVRRAEVEQLR
jgi:transposase